MSSHNNNNNNNNNNKFLSTRKKGPKIEETYVGVLQTLNERIDYTNS